MRKIQLLLFLCMFFNVAGAADVAPDEIRLVAETFVAAQHEILESTTPTPDLFNVTKVRPLIHPTTRQRFAYVAEISPQGFVVLAAHSTSYPVIAYSFRHDWRHDAAAQSPLYHLLRADYRCRQKTAEPPNRNVKDVTNDVWTKLRHGSTTVLTLDFQQWPELGSTPTGGWVTTTWHQHGPFYDLCPIDPETGNRSVVGCTATALAQIINFHRTVGDLEFGAADRYTTETRLIQIDADSAAYDFPSFPRLNRYLGELKHSYETAEPLNDQDRASLSFACGVALNMDYTSSGSGADMDLADEVLRLDMGYESADYHGNLVQADAYHEFYYALQSDMMNGLPALLEIAESPNYNLHAVVCDGYNTNGFYHLNFGWGADQPDAITDAWYYLPSAMPEDYQVVLAGIIQIRPDSLNASQLVCDTETIQVPPTPVDEPSDLAQFTLSNDSESDISIFSIASSEPFLISPTTSGFSDALGPLVLPAGDELPIFVRCTPDSIGPFHGNIIVHSSAETAYMNLHVQCYGVPEGGTAIADGSVSGTWTAAASPYYVCGDVTVEPNSQLEIRPGTDVVIMDRFHMFVTGQAQLLAQGAQGDSIRFRAYDADVGWNGIEFNETGGNDTLAFCRISDARGTYNDDKGGALNIISSSPSILNSRLIGNQGAYGGAMYCLHASPHVRYCTFENNESIEVGGAMVLEHSSPRVENSLFYDNVANTNGSFFNSNASTPLFINVTVADNKDAKYMGKFIYLNDGNWISFQNCILWAPSGDNLDIFMNENNTLEFHYSDVLTTYINQAWPIVGYPYQNNEVLWGSGNMAQEPQLVHTDSLTYLLSSNSPCVDAGNPDPLYNDNEDPDDPGMALWPARGTLRNDMGAYGGHSQQFVVPVELAAFSATVREQAVILWWQTLSESKNYGFVVERCSDRRSFQKIAFLAGQGTTVTPHRYEYQDVDVEAGTYYYRLKHVDVEGGFGYSNVIEVNVGAVRRYYLADNYPNPFNEHTVISFEIPHATKVELAIYNTRGELVRQVVQAVRKPGVYREIWDGRDRLGNAVSSGCYFYRLQAGEFEKIKKLLLVR